MWETILFNMGRKSDVAGTSNTSSLFSWVKSISSRVTTINTNTARGVVKSIQRGSFSFPSSGTHSVSISEVAMSKTLVINLGSTNGASTVRLSSSTSISCYWPAGQGFSGGSTIYWNLIEFY